MATNFPGSLDSFTNPSSSSTLDSPSHAAQHANINDAMVAVQTKLGTGSGTIGTWTSYTPTVTQTVNITKTVTFAQYAQINKVVHYTFSFALTSAGTAGGLLQVSLPVAAAAGQRGTGLGQFFDANVSTNYVMASYMPTATTLGFTDVNSGASAFGAAPAVTVANGDFFFGFITYVAA